MAIFFFCGIGGIGMSSIALYLKRTGHTVIGSDRSFDAGDNPDQRVRLEQAGIQIVPQDGSGVPADTDTFVVSTAVEDRIPDVGVAKQKGLLIKKRAEVLADIMHAHQGIAVGGTSGKTTVTAMIGHILAETGRQPVMINGGISLNTYNGEPASNLIFGTGNICVAEADESDGSIALYTPAVAVVTNLSLDHKPIDEIRPLFEAFLNRATIGGVVNADCPHTPEMTLTQKNLVSFSVTGRPADVTATDIQTGSNGICFRVNGIKAVIPVIGRHNAENALAALAAVSVIGVSLADGVRALSTFQGTHRRLEAVGMVRGVRIFDDYAHNPEKIRAAVTALQESFSDEGRLFVVYQPHGFAPLRLMKETLIHMLNQTLNDRIIWIMPDVYYAGGTVAKDISSADIVTSVVHQGHQAYYIPTRPDIMDFIVRQVKPDDRVVVMGARDASLSDFARQIQTALSKRGH